MSQIEIIILAILYEEERYGYEIESLIQQRKLRDWINIGFSTIYNSLKNLEKKGLIGSRHEEEYGSPSRKVFFIKLTAKASVRDLIKSILISPQNNNEFIIGLAFTHLLTKPEIKECFKKYKENLEKKRDLMQKKLSEDNEIYLKTLISYSFKLTETEMEWIEAYIKE